MRFHAVACGWACLCASVQHCVRGCVCACARTGARECGMAPCCAFRTGTGKKLPHQPGAPRLLFSLLTNACRMRTALAQPLPYRISRHGASNTLRPHNAPCTDNWQLRATVVTFIPTTGHRDTSVAACLFASPVTWSTTFSGTERAEAWTNGGGKSRKYVR